MIALWMLLAALAAFVAVLLARALRFTPPETPPVEPMPVEVDADTTAAHMQAMIRCKTVSYGDPSLEDASEFEAFPALLASLYPRVHAACPQERIGTRALLYRWQGRQSAAPTVFMAHYDVVPADAARWRHPPFDGVIEDGILWGRGTLDTKGTLLAVMEAAERLVGEGFVPEQDIYLCFGGDEETHGTGAQAIVQALSARGVHPALVLDEGGAVVEGVFPGVKRPAALVGTSEKGQVNVRLRVQSQGGHASAPPPHTPVGVLAKAVCAAEAKPFSFTLTPAARALFDTLGRHSTLLYRVIFANLWCFAPVLNLLCKKTGGEMNALVRTTCAFTQMRGSDAANVMPPEASVSANIRIIGGETVQSVRDRLARIIANPAIEVTAEGGSEPSPDSITGDAPWQRLSRAIAQTWPEAVISPYLMVAASDSRAYTRICEHVYRFCPMPLSAAERRLIHGNDERIPVDKLCDTVRFYVRLMRAC